VALPPPPKPSTSDKSAASASLGASASSGGLAKAAIPTDAATINILMRTASLPQLPPADQPCDLNQRDAQLGAVSGAVECAGSARSTRFASGAASPPPGAGGADGDATQNVTVKRVSCHHPGSSMEALVAGGRETRNAAATQLFSGQCGNACSRDSLGKCGSALGPGGSRPSNASRRPSNGGSRPSCGAEGGGEARPQSATALLTSPRHRPPGQPNCFRPGPWMRLHPPIPKSFGPRSVKEKKKLVCMGDFCHVDPQGVAEEVA
jgi:hypothetical protein